MSRPNINIFVVFYSGIVVLIPVRDHLMKPLDPIQGHRNEHFSVDLTKYLACRAFQGLPVREMDSPDLLFENIEEEEVSRGQIRAIGQLCHPPGFRGLETIIGRA
jgi:hypothetical protein